MAFTAPSYDVDNIQGLADLTQDQAAAVKVLFDKTGADTKTYIIALLAELASVTAGSSAAENLGSATIAGITGNTIHDQISNLLAIAQAAQLGDLLPITDDLLSDTAGQLNERATTHIADAVIHITAEERTAWNAKLDASSSSAVAGKIYAYQNLGGL